MHTGREPGENVDEPKTSIFGTRTLQTKLATSCCKNRGLADTWGGTQGNHQQGIQRIDESDCNAALRVMPSAADRPDLILHEISRLSIVQKLLRSEHPPAYDFNGNREHDTAKVSRPMHMVM